MEDTTPAALTTTALSVVFLISLVPAVIETPFPSVTEPAVSVAFPASSSVIVVCVLAALLYSVPSTVTLLPAVEPRSIVTIVLLSSTAAAIFSPPVVVV